MKFVFGPLTETGEKLPRQKISVDHLCTLDNAKQVRNTTISL